ncbi:hypothetical protein EV196_11311 [Mariniflexile fucanivorans]|uniref:Uncharacterized protein n=1 Tax=Mariniflexile fucanivorans TaxID=264023 RepID=A0A4R1RA57_9FLAO|nr:hypothetical protein [Mariniflexile fucanivorans]TCL62470.1 hypothetical protein EV196_11311 [Mariniflexile fucanivorans]
MNNLKIIIIALAFLFVLVTTFLELPPLLHNILYGVMGVFAVFFLIVKRKDLKIEGVFSKEQDAKN